MYIGVGFGRMFCNQIVIGVLMFGCGLQFLILKFLKWQLKMDLGLCLIINFGSGCGLWFNCR